MTIKELKEIALHAVKGTVPATYAEKNVDMNQAFVDGLYEFAGSINQFMKNRYDLYDIIISAADEVLPKKVIDQIGMFAEVKTVGQGQKAMFKTKLGRSRAKKFLTQVGLSGVYETFRLDSKTFELKAHAVGGGATVDFERLLDGAESLAEVMDIITEGLVDAVFYEVHRALHSAFASMQGTNKKSTATFEADKMLALCNVVKAYGSGAAIFACPEFIAKMGPDAIVPAISGAAQGIYSPKDIEAIHDTGYISIFRGNPVIQIPNSFIDERNTKTWLDPQYAYVLPTGGEKVVKVVLEGQTQINDFKNRDNSLEVYAYKKMGAGILTLHNWGIYKNTDVADTFESPYGF